MFKNDIDVLSKHIPDTYDHKLVLAEQVRLVRKHMPLALLGAVFTALCFFATRLIGMDLIPNQRIINMIWLVYQMIFITLLWLSLQRIFKKPEAVTIKSLRVIFGTLAGLFIAAIVFGMPVFVIMLYGKLTMSLPTAKILIGIWMFFHVVLIYVCWVKWQKIKVVARDALASPYSVNHASEPSLGKDYPQLVLADAMQQSTLTSHHHYLAHYAAYSVIFICTLAIGCSWAMAICKAFTSSIQSSTQIIVLMGLHFGLLSGAISSLAMFWRIYVAFALPSLLTWFFILVYVEDGGSTILAFAVIGLLLFDIVFARHTWSNTIKAILLYLENSNLVAQLQVKTKQLEAASKAKTRFLAAASHDLRQPVHALSLFLEALSDTDLNSDQVQIVNYAKSASQSSREMLNTILDYSHLESSQMTPHFSATNLNNPILNLFF